MKAENVIGPVTIEERPPRSYLGIRLETPFNGMFAQVTGKLKDLRKWVRENLPSEEGPFFLRYYHCDMAEIMKIEVGFITEARPSAPGEIQQGRLPGGKYATLIYRGNGLRGNQALMKWARENGVRFDAEVPELAESYVCRYEAYLTDYRVEPRKLLWDVELSIKVVEARGAVRASGV